jgi:hypothetical protein
LYKITTDSLVTSKAAGKAVAVALAAGLVSQES